MVLCPLATTKQQKLIRKITKIDHNNNGISESDFQTKMKTSLQIYLFHDFPRS